MARNRLTLKDVRLALGLTQKQLAEIAGVHRKTLCGWERGQNISDSNLSAAALAYRCSEGDVRKYWTHSKAAINSTKRRVKQARKKIKVAC